MISNPKRSFRWLLSISVWLLLFSTAVKAQEPLPSPTNEFFVNDYARILSAETRDYIYQTSRQYQAEGGPQVVVATVPSLGGRSIEDYSIELARAWGIGDKTSNNGVLILLALEEREIRVEVGYGLEGTITDSMSGRFLREVSKELGADDFDSGLKNLYQLVINELEEPGSFDETHKDDSSSFLFPLIVILILFLLLSRKGPGGRGRFGGGYRGYHGGFGGGFGGGSSGGFRGGGGSFGGGGASGKFIEV